MSPNGADPGIDLVAAALREPQAWQDVSPARWSQLLGQARTAGLLARVAWMLAQAHAGDDFAAATAKSAAGAAEPTPQSLAEAGPWPMEARAHVASAWRLAIAQRIEVRRELRHIAHALAPLAAIGAPVVLLKGAAYVAADLPPARCGRLFGDIDILVPRNALDRAELNLQLHGWENREPSEYNQRYYRQWMHELPPMAHRQRGTALDVHHALLPPTSRLKSPPAPLFERARALPAAPGLMPLRVLAPEDMLLALRDLSDMDLLIRHGLAGDAGFVSRLVERGLELGLGRPLAYGLLGAARVLATPVPRSDLDRVAGLTPAAPGRAAMDWLWRHALRTRHPAADSTGTPFALHLLYLRGHWLRMPLPMLIRHLAIKALKLHEPPTAP
jgi:Uncharacterised nucleotidyltransferase